ncbi:MAG: SPOR domain-containing protein [Methylococcales bacterium]|nr:SPOR domain-containing protein [Methylococcales bacterium]
MTRDYKSRVQERKAQGRAAVELRRQFNRNASTGGLWRWMLITALIIAFVVFLVYLSTVPKQIPQTLKTMQGKAGLEKIATPMETKKPETTPGPKSPQFDFYTILPDKEVVVPEYEIKTRSREERVGKAKETHYIMQAGSFKTFKEAERLRAKLALMGIESKVQKAKVGRVNWYRVKMGPFTRTASVNSIRSRLRQNGIDVIITETGG